MNRRHPLGNTFSEAFTLVELLVVVAIIGILCAILLPVLQNMQVASKTAKCVSNLRQWGIAYQQYITDNSGALPTALVHNEANWQEAIAPYIVPATAASAGNLRFTMRSNLGCPSDPTADWKYGGNNYIDPSVYSRAPHRVWALPGRVNVAVMADCGINFWTVAASAGSSGIGYARHKGKANFCFVDAHVETLTASQAVARPVIVDPGP